MTNIFIANLDWDITSEDLSVTFSSFGKVHLAHVVYDAQTKRSKGFGYVEMESAEEAINAIQALNGMEVNGRKLDVKIASPKSNRPAKKEVEAKPFIKKPFQRADGAQGGYKKPYDPDRKPYNPENKRPYDPNRKPYDPNNKRPYDPDKKPYNPDYKKPYDPNYKRPYDPDKKPYDPNYKKPYDPDRKPYNPDYKKPYDPDKKPYNPDYKKDN
jgi:RNA recognition motif-containing protein